MLDRLLELAPQILPYAEPVWERLDELRRASNRILFEGAQAVMLDVDHGTYPFVTSSNTVAATAAAGSGIGRPRWATCWDRQGLHHPRGLGPVPDRADRRDRRSCWASGPRVRHRHRPARRCGWFDAALVRQAVKVGGIQGLALTKLDVLDGLPELKICTGYRIGGERCGHLPAAPGAQAAAEPVYEVMEGWSGSTAARGPGPICRRRRSSMSGGSRSWSEAPVTLLSTSPERDDTILVRDPFEG